MSQLSDYITAENEKTLKYYQEAVERGRKLMGSPAQQVPLSNLDDAMVERAAQAGLAAKIPGPHCADPCCYDGREEPISGTCFLFAFQMKFLASVMLEAAFKEAQ